MGMHTRKVKALQTSRWSLTLFLLALPVGSVPVLYASAGTEGASFLDIPIGGGPAALGSAYDSLATDAYAPVYNPGGLGFLTSNQLAGQHLSYLESVYDEYIGFVHPLGGGKAMGVSAQYLGSGDIPSLDKSGNALGTYDSHYGAYAIAYGQTIGERMSLGLTGKVVEAKISDVSAHAYAGDAGAFYKANEKLSLSAVVANVGSPLTFVNQKDSLPVNGRLGAAYRFVKQGLIAVEGVYPGSGQASLRTGVMWKPLEAVSIRAGYRTDTVKELSALAGFSTGVGLTLWGQELDYAWVPYGDLGDTQYFSLVIKFGEEQERKRNFIQYQTIKAYRMAERTLENEIDEQQLMELLTDDKQAVATNTTKDVHP
jgi:hypothetical protein